jgi:hypothetical protein
MQIIFPNPKQLILIQVFMQCMLPTSIVNKSIMILHQINKHEPSNQDVVIFSSLKQLRKFSTNIDFSHLSKSESMEKEIPVE